MITSIVPNVIYQKLDSGLYFEGGLIHRNFWLGVQLTIMEIPASILVLTKLCAPATRLRMVPRPRLLERLTAETGAPLVLVSAPAGYGKTTLLAAWRQSLLQNGAAVAWYALDASDDDPLLFGSYLVASLEQALGPTSGLAQVAQLLRFSPEVDLQRILSAVINAVASNDRHCVLVLDDYHLIGLPAIHKAIAFLLEHLPGNMRVAIGSRTTPPLPLARLRVRRQLLEIRPADLRFTKDETAQFLNAIMKLDLSPGLVAALEERTEGWAAGLQLAALSLSDRPDKEGFIASFTGGNRYLVNYLLEEVFNRQPEETRSFLLQTSILKRLCASLCDALLHQAAGSQEAIARLEQANLFMLPLDDAGSWYRYHHLFRDFLQARLQKLHPDRLAGLHRTASEWHAAHGSRHEAVGHAIQSQDWAYAAALVEQQGVDLALRGEFSTLYEWSSAFPEEVMQVSPSLCLFQANALAVGYRQKNRSKVEARLRQVEQAAQVQEDGPVGQLLRGQAATTRAILEAVTPDPTIDPSAQFLLAQKALDLLSDEDPARSAVALSIGYAHLALHDAAAGCKALEDARQLALASCNYFGVIEAAFHQARLAHALGQLSRAVDICLRGRADAAMILPNVEPELPAAGCLDIALGCVQLEQDALEEAERNLLAGLDRVGWGMNPYYLMIACLALFRLREIQGHPAEAVEYLTRLEEAWPDIAFCTRSVRILHKAQNASQDPAVRAAAAAWCRDFYPPSGDDVLMPGMGPLGAAEARYQAYLAWARLQVISGGAHTALPYIERQLDLARTHGLTTRLIELSLVEAQARHAQHDERRAREAFERALIAAQPSGYVRSFDGGAVLTQLLVDAASGGACRDDARRILSVIGAPVSPVVSLKDVTKAAFRADNGAVLSQREMDVLRLMAEGASNQAIAERLVITVGTVKSHINHILNKLNASNRTAAVARARQLGWLDIKDNPVLVN